MVFVTGDCHANFKKFNTTNFPQQKEMGKQDIVLICGDFGGIWHDSKEERYWLNWLAEKPFTLCFVDGNHENMDRLYGNEFEVVDFHGGKAHKIRDNIYHLMRGYVFEFDGKKFFAFGGASSHDIKDGILDRNDFASEEDFKHTCNLYSWMGMMFRINHVSWWKEELPSEEEMQRGIDNLAKHNYEVDYVITHCLPQDVASAAGYFGGDILTNYFDKLITLGLKFIKWWSGHYHFNDTVLGKYNVLYGDIVRII